MISRGEGNTVSDVISASWCSHRKDVCGVHEAELHPGHSAAIAIREENPLPESSFPTKAAYFGYHSLSL